MERQKLRTESESYHQSVLDKFGLKARTSMEIANQDTMSDLNNQSELNSESNDNAAANQDINLSPDQTENFEDGHNAIKTDELDIKFQVDSNKQEQVGDNSVNMQDNCSIRSNPLSPPVLEEDDSQAMPNTVRDTFQIGRAHV